MKCLTMCSLVLKKNFCVFTIPAPKQCSCADGVTGRNVEAFSQTFQFIHGTKWNWNETWNIGNIFLYTSREGIYIMWWLVELSSHSCRINHFPWEELILPVWRAVGVPQDRILIFLVQNNNFLFVVCRGYSIRRGRIYIMII